MDLDPSNFIPKIKRGVIYLVSEGEICKSLGYKYTLFGQTYVLSPRNSFVDEVVCLTLAAATKDSIKFKSSNLKLGKMATGFNFKSNPQD